MELFNIGPLELLFLLAIAVLVVGPQRAAELAGQLGRLLASLRRNVNLVRSELRQGLEEGSRPLAEVQRALREAGEAPPQRASEEQQPSGAGRTPPPPEPAQAQESQETRP